jgi:hypothetical protein
MNEEMLFLAALERPADARASFLDKACAGQVALRERLEILLRAHQSPGSFLAKPAVDHDATDVAFGCGALALGNMANSPQQLPPSPHIEEGPGTRIGPYKLLQQIGEGGMGTVFMAEQTQPVHRKVALKIVKPGMSSRQVIARFEAERQA